MPDTFETRIAALDLSRFDAIPSQSSAWDRRSLLACQAAIRQRVGRYVYLEIGLHLGGSLQTHVLDRSCVRMHSIDPRPRWQSDARGVDFRYPDNSTRRMIEALGRLSVDAAGPPYSAALLPETLLATDIARTGVLDSPQLATVKAAAFRGTLFSLRANDHYRAFANRWPWGTLRPWRSRKTAGRRRAR